MHHVRHKRASGDVVPENEAVSWDISIQDLPDGVATVADIPDDYRPKPLGHRSALIERIRGFAPTANFSDPAWGELVTPDFVIEFNMGSDEVADAIMLHVRGGGGAADFVGALLHDLGLRAIDCSEGEIFSYDTGDASFVRWQQYRDRIIGN